MGRVEEPNPESLAMVFIGGEGSRSEPDSYRIPVGSLSPYRKPDETILRELPT